MGGTGVVSRAGAGSLRETAEFSGLVAGWNAALIDTYRGPPIHAPGQVLADQAVAVADGADAVSGIAVLGDRTELFGSVASMPTAWWLLERLDAGLRRSTPTTPCGTSPALQTSSTVGDSRLDLPAADPVLRGPALRSNL